MAKPRALHVPLHGKNPFTNPDLQMQPIHELDLLGAILSSTHQGIAPDDLKGCFASHSEMDSGNLNPITDARPAPIEL